MLSIIDIEQIFTTNNLLLVSIAYGQIGSKDVAEDLVQDTFLNWLKADHKKIVDNKAYLIRAVKNACINYRKSFFNVSVSSLEEKEKTLNKIVIEPQETKIELEESLWAGFVRTMQNLAPAERAVFFLKDILSIDYAEISEILDKKKENIRQLLCRARKNIGRKTPKFNIDLSKVKEHFDLFNKSCRTGDILRFAEMLKKDI